MSDSLIPQEPRVQSDPNTDTAGLEGAHEILMIEDSATDAELALRAFKRSEFATPIRIASSGEQGLDYLFGAGADPQHGSNRAELILLDINLPGMSGVEFLRHIKGDERTRDIPVIVLSLSDRDRDVLRCIELGADAYLVKPLNFENFIRVTTSLKLRMVASPSSRPKKPSQ